jgi:Thioredoxin like C-terminal domain
VVVGGAGTVTVTRDGKTTTIPVSGAPNMRQIVTDDENGSGSVEVALSKGLQAFSFTYG